MSLQLLRICKNNKKYVIFKYAINEKHDIIFITNSQK